MTRAAQSASNQSSSNTVALSQHMMDAARTTDAPVNAPCPIRIIWRLKLFSGKAVCRMPQAQNTGTSAGNQLRSVILGEAISQ